LDGALLLLDISVPLITPSITLASVENFNHNQLSAPALVELLASAQLESSALLRVDLAPINSSLQ